MLKLIGSILILCASVSACYFYEKNEMRKIHLCERYCELIKFIKSQIQYFSTPIDKIFSSYKAQLALSEDEFTEYMELPKLRNSLKWNDKEEKAILEPFFSSLGKGLKAEEVSLCSYTVTELEKITEKKKADYPSKIKSFRAIAMFVGACAVILLI
ncbi:MAG: hypothetical protein IJZ04_00890 [Clostridia bacterium]|nr:hypothetical protein [Clostridia bacterium]